MPDDLPFSAGIDCPPGGETNAALQCLNERLEEEIKRVARLLHGEAGQLLVATHLAVDELAADLPPQERDRLLRIKDLLDRVEGELRRFSHELRPTLLDDLGVPAAVEFLAEGIAKRAGISILVEALFEKRLKPSIETALYRIIQEALNNAARHARAARIHIRLWREVGTVRAMVRDDGIGFDVAAAFARGGERGLGLVSMEERLQHLGGSLRLRTSPGQGTQIEVSIPVEGGGGDPNPARG